MTKTGLYPGTFDPMTNGHVDIIRRALRVVDHLVVAIGVHASKQPMLSLDERFDLIEREAEPIAKEVGGKVSTASFSGLVVNAADEFGASIIVRGLRGSVDYEYEEAMVGMNRTMNPKVETVFLAASPDTGHISSTLVRQIAQMDGDISPFVPVSVCEKMMARVAELKAKG